MKNIEMDYLMFLAGIMSLPPFFVSHGNDSLAIGWFIVILFTLSKLLEAR